MTCRWIQSDVGSGLVKECMVIRQGCVHYVGMKGMTRDGGSIRLNEGKISESKSNLK